MTNLPIELTQYRNPKNSKLSNTTSNLFNKCDPTHEPFKIPKTNNR